MVHIYSTVVDMGYVKITCTGHSTKGAIAPGVVGWGPGGCGHKTKGSVAGPPLIATPSALVGHFCRRDQAF